MGGEPIRRGDAATDAHVQGASARLISFKKSVSDHPCVTTLHSVACQVRGVPPRIAIG